MNILILTEGGRSSGLGHITRCTALAQAVEERGEKALLVVQGDDAAGKAIAGLRGEMLSWREWPDRLERLLADADAVVIDSYLADRELYERISERVGVAVYLDDTKRIDYPPGTVVNGATGAGALGYPEQEGSRYLLGLSYVFLREAFWNVPEKETRQNLKTVMITFGGEDLRQMVPSVLRLLAAQYPELQKRVVIGAGFSNRQEIEDAADSRTELLFQPDAAGMREAMLQADIAISAGGQTLYELARIGVPTIAVAVAENQVYNIRGCLDRGFIEFAGWWNDEGIMDDISACLDRLSPLSRRKAMSLKGRAEVDGQGARRVVEAILSGLEKKGR